MIRAENELEAALNYLAETDHVYAKGKSQLLDCEILCKQIRARVFLTSAGTVAERNAEAEIHADVKAADKMLVDATLMFESIKAQRASYERDIEVWRSLEATRRRVLA